MLCSPILLAWEQIWISLTLEINGYMDNPHGFSIHPKQGVNSEEGNKTSQLL